MPVVSIGNLTVGGTGKTPMVEWVARWYRQRGIRVAILSRGYGQAGEGGGVNDEALVLEENLQDVPHLQDPDRVTMAGVAVEELESQLLVLDDAFQHRKLAGIWTSSCWTRSTRSDRVGYCLEDCSASPRARCGGLIWSWSLVPILFPPKPL